MIPLLLEGGEGGLLRRGEDAVDLAVGGLEDVLDLGELLLRCQAGVLEDRPDLGVGGVEDGLDLGLLVSGEVEGGGEMLQLICAVEFSAAEFASAAALSNAIAVMAGAIRSARAAGTAGAGALFQVLDHLGELRLLGAGEEGVDLGDDIIDDAVAGGFGLLADGLELRLGGFQDGGDFGLLASSETEGVGEALEQGAAGLSSVHGGP